MATLEDIAKKVGVSKGTVSKALNGAGDVSETMRRMVLEAAVELGYTRLRRNDDTPKLAVFITTTGALSSWVFPWTTPGWKSSRPAAFPPCCTTTGSWATPM